MSFGDDSGIGDQLDGAMSNNDQLINMQTQMRARSLGMLNDEMVRSSTFFGFGSRPEPNYMANPGANNLGNPNPNIGSAYARAVYNLDAKESGIPTTNKDM